MFIHIFHKYTVIHLFLEKNLCLCLTLIPAVTIAGVAVRDVMPYTFVALVFTGCVFALALFL